MKSPAATSVPSVPPNPVAPSSRGPGGLPHSIPAWLHQAADSSALELHDLPSHHRPSPPPPNVVPEVRHPLDPFVQQPLADDGGSEMSRTPLLLRTSPAFGTGSFGAVPITSLDSASSSDVDDTGPKRKGKARALDKQSQSIIGRLEHDHHMRPLASDAVSESLPAKRRGIRGRESGSARSLLSETLRHQHEQEIEFGNADYQAYGSAGSSRGSSTTTHRRSVRISTSGSSSSDDELPKHDGSDEIEDDDVYDKSTAYDEPDDNSPYAQVRASVAPTDDLSLSINTPRMWFLSLLFAILGSSTNLFFSLRYPSVSITPVIALLLAHPLGLLWDQLLSRQNDPPETFVNGHRQWDNSPITGSSDQRLLSQGASIRSFRVSRSTRLRLWFAQGRWNAKEHCCVYISSNVSFGFAFATDIIVEQSQFYHQKLGVIYQILLILSTQILGYALAGLGRRYLVHPSGMIWPGTLMSTAMFTTLHTNENKPAGDWKVSRIRFFLYVLVGSVAFYFLPGLLMPALSYFNILTWFAPKNVVVANLFGVVSGLGLFPMTFDWSQIAYIGSPLVVPFWAAMNVVGGLVVVMWIVAPILYYTNTMYSAYMPILSSAVFDNTGKPYDVSKILTKKFLFDEKAYLNYSRVFLPITYVLSYALQFAGLAALITHTACWHGRGIWRQWRRSLAEIKNKQEYRPLSATEPPSSPIARMRIRLSSDGEQDADDILTREDVHNRLMRRYDDVPVKWYFLTGLTMTIIGIFVVEYYPIHLPWYGLLLALGICTVLFIPIGIVAAITNQHTSIYLICQLICGVVFPGRPVANMVFIAYGYITSAQGIKFTSDLKLGHYMKVPPRILFNVQLVATIASSLTQISVLNWMLTNIRGICTSEAINGFTCPIARVHFNGSILWGVIGPARFFGPGALYRPLVWAFLIGAIAPIILWLFARQNKKSILRKVNLPVVFGSLSWIPPATGLNFSVWAVVCWLFNYLIKRRSNAWWQKYTMTLSAALDSGLALGVVVVFFGIVYPGWMDGFKWWGTEVFKQGCDWQACPYKTRPDDQPFGPPKW